MEGVTMSTPQQQWLDQGAAQVVQQLQHQPLQVQQLLQQLQHQGHQQQQEPHAQQEQQQYRVVVISQEQLQALQQGTGGQLLTLNDLGHAAGAHVPHQQVHANHEVSGQQVTVLQHKVETHAAGHSPTQQQQQQQQVVGGGPMQQQLLGHTTSPSIRDALQPEAQGTLARSSATKRQHETSHIRADGAGEPGPVGTQVRIGREAQKEGHRSPTVPQRVQETKVEVQPAQGERVGAPPSPALSGQGFAEPRPPKRVRTHEEGADMQSAGGAAPAGPGTPNSGMKQVSAPAMALAQLQQGHYQVLHSPQPQQLVVLQQPQQHLLGGPQGQQQGQPVLLRHLSDVRDSMSTLSNLPMVVVPQTQTTSLSQPQQQQVLGMSQLPIRHDSVNSSLLVAAAQAVQQQQQQQLGGVVPVGYQLSVLQAGPGPHPAGSVDASNGSVQTLNGYALAQQHQVGGLPQEAGQQVQLVYNQQGQLELQVVPRLAERAGTQGALLAALQQQQQQQQLGAAVPQGLQVVLHSEGSGSGLQQLSNAQAQGVPGLERWGSSVSQQMAAQQILAQLPAGTQLLGMLPQQQQQQVQAAPQHKPVLLTHLLQQQQQQQQQQQLQQQLVVHEGQGQAMAQRRQLQQQQQGDVQGASPQLQQQPGLDSVRGAQGRSPTLQGPLAFAPGAAGVRPPAAQLPPPQHTVQHLPLPAEQRGLLVHYQRAGLLPAGQPLTMGAMLGLPGLMGPATPYMSHASREEVEAALAEVLDVMKHKPRGRPVKYIDLGVNRMALKFHVGVKLNHRVESMGATDTEVAAHMLLDMVKIGLGLFVDAATAAPPLAASHPEEQMTISLSQHPSHYSTTFVQRVVAQLINRSLVSASELSQSYTRACTAGCVPGPCFMSVAAALSAFN